MFSSPVQLSSVTSTLMLWWPNINLTSHTWRKRMEERHPRESFTWVWLSLIIIIFSLDRICLASFVLYVLTELFSRYRFCSLTSTSVIKNTWVNISILIRVGVLIFFILNSHGDLTLFSTTLTFVSFSWFPQSHLF